MSCLAKAIKGHEDVQTYLFKMMEEKRFPHALLFQGPSGVGKKKWAWAMAQNLLCDESFPACGDCLSCLKVEQEKSEFVMFIEPQSLQIKLEDVKKMKSFLFLQSEKNRVIIVNEAHCLNLQAVNSLLKIVEETPEGSYFIFISSAPFSIPITLRSRLQSFRFKRLSKEVIQELTSHEDVEDWMIAASQGRMDVISDLKNRKELFHLALDLWKRFFKSQSSPYAFSFPLEFKDRKQALFVAQAWNWLLRDARLFKAGERESLIYGNEVALIKEMADLSSQGLDFLIEQSWVLERNIRSHIDSVLCFEHFVIAMHSLIKESRYVDRQSRSS